MKNTSSTVLKYAPEHAYVILLDKTSGQTGSGRTSAITNSASNYNNLIVHQIITGAITNSASNYTDIRCM